MLKKRYIALTCATAIAACLHVGETRSGASKSAQPLVTETSELGKSYAPFVVTTYADAWLAAATALEDGKSVGESQEIFQSTWKAGRTRAFQKHVAPSFQRLLPEGTEPADPATRKRVASHWRAFARGLRSGR
jgi:hypothetical protein